MAFLSSWLWLVLLAGVNSSIGNILLKLSNTKAAPDASFVDKLFSPWFIGGLFFYGVNVILFVKALEKAPVSVAYPLLAITSFALVVLSAGYLFDEKLNLYQWAGLGLATLSIFLMARPS